MFWFASIVRVSIKCSQTSTATTFMLHELAKNPEVQERVLQEIQTVMGDRRSPTFEDIQKMTLLRGCVRETLRYNLVVTYYGHARQVSLVYS